MKRIEEDASAISLWSHVKRIEEDASAISLWSHVKRIEEDASAETKYVSEDDNEVSVSRRLGCCLLWTDYIMGSLVYYGMRVFVYVN